MFFKIFTFAELNVFFSQESERTAIVKETLIAPDLSRPIVAHDHAISRLKGRWHAFGRNRKKPETEEEWRETLERVLKASKPANMSKVEVVTRLIEHGTDVTYYWNDAWGMRLIVDESGTSRDIISVEVPFRRQRR